jgi:para-nitrobenzyl esterase
VRDSRTVGSAGIVAPHCIVCEVRVASDSELVLDTPAGALRGRIEQGVTCFRAVPYAEPPVGELRFAPPLPAARWAGVREATRPGPVAPQAPSRLRHVMGDFERAQDESCLSLTVWTPRADAQGRPVLVWLHGGAFMTGGGDLAWYDGARLAREGDVVVVGVNYRLGALGFLRAAGVSPGNLGLMDQALAVQWVARHIAAFGGDPQRVTLMGQSAGSMSIGLLLSRDVPLQACRAILMSAPLGLPPMAPERAERIGEAFLRALGVDSQAATVAEQVRRAPLPELMRATGAAARFQAEHLSPPGDLTPPFLPVADGEFLPSPDRHPVALASAAGRVDVLIGTTRDEVTAFPDAGEAMTRGVFEDPSATWADRAARAGRRAYFYRLDWAPPGSAFGAPHCIDLPFVFGTREAFASAPMLSGGSVQSIEALSDRVRAAWLSFVKTGAPTGNGCRTWPPVGLAWRACMQLSEGDERVSPAA